MNSKVIVRTIAIAAVALTVTSFGYVLVGARSSQDDGSMGAADRSQAMVLEDGVVTWAEHEAATSIPPGRNRAMPVAASLP